MNALDLFSWIAEMGSVLEHRDGGYEECNCGEGAAENCGKVVESEGANDVLNACSGQALAVRPW